MLRLTTEVSRVLDQKHKTVRWLVASCISGTVEQNISLGCANYSQLKPLIKLISSMQPRLRIRVLYPMIWCQGRTKLSLPWHPAFSTV